MRKKIFRLMLLVTAALLAGAFYPRVGVAERRPDTFGSSKAIDEPVTRCFQAPWPVISKRARRAYKAKKSNGYRCGRVYGRRTAEIVPNRAPVISGFRPRDTFGADWSVWNVPAAGKLIFDAIATDADRDTLVYTYAASGGKINGLNGPMRVWDLTGVAPGTYKIMIEVDDGCGCVTSHSASATVFRIDP